MIQFNLLPDVKLEYIKAQRTRRLVISVTILVTVASMAILGLVLSVGALQKKHLSDINHDVSSESSKLTSTPQINRILTVQNQLASLTQLHDQKPAASRMFDYLNQITPNVVSITSFNIDMNADTASITGSADALSSINQYVDTLKFTKYQVKGDSSTTAAFSAVVLSSFGLNNTAAAGSANAQPASYTITLSYDPKIFDITNTVSLIVPQIISTRSEVDQPTDLFTAPVTTKTTSGTSKG
jgi:Tfp pilus assembly protein PilN